MGLLSKKPILLNDNFDHYNDPFYSNNQLYNITTHQSLPFNKKEVLVPYNSQVYCCPVNKALHHLLDNDKYIVEYFSKIQNQSMTTAQGEQAFNQNIQTLTSNIYENTFNTHYSIYHPSKYPTTADGQIPLSTVYREYLKADCSNLDIEEAAKQFVKTEKINNCTIIKNDLVSYIEFDDSPNVRSATNYIGVAISNKYTNHKFMTAIIQSKSQAATTTIPNTSNTKYIYKEYYSGKKEFYIYIPSTFTFYNELDSLNLETNPHNDVTYIRIKLNKRHFDINHIYNIQINGQSLPLMIHKDKYTYFSDQILPSMVRTVCTSISSDNNSDTMYDENTNLYSIYFCCYGTDAQAIKILAD